MTHKHFEELQINEALKYTILSCITIYNCKFGNRLTVRKT